MANTKSILFDASGEYGARASANLTGFNFSVFTLECWLYLDALSTTAQIAARWGATAGDRQFTWAVLTDGTLYLAARCTNGQSPTCTSNSSVVTTGSWQHYAVYFNTATPAGQIWKNGSTITTNVSAAGTAGTINAGAYPFEVGCREGGTVNQLYGKIDEFRVWNDERTTTEVNNNKGVELAGNEAGLIFYGKFENNGNDSQTNVTANDLTVTNATYSTSVPFGEGEPPAAVRHNLALMGVGA